MSPPTLEQKVRFLGSGEAFSPLDRPVTVTETHMSWVFLTRALVYKMKKPVRFPFLDFTSLAKRHRNCRAELRLNRRLAGDVYRRLVPLRCDASGQLSLTGDGEIVEWLVEMQRLPADEMLDVRIRTSRLRKADVLEVAALLARFYASARPQIRDGGAYLRHLQEESAVNRKLLMHSGLGVAGSRTSGALDDLDALLTRWSPVIASRIEAGRIIEGHGDLRPGHICLVEPPRIYDCLEFARNMRLLDPYDEMNYLGLECGLLGANWVQPLLLDVLEQHLGHRPAPGLIATYGAFRAMLRARLCVAHLLDSVPKEPQKWVRKGRRYLAIAERECLRALD